MPHDSNLIDIISIGLSLAFIFGALAHRCKIPPLVGYLLAGICIGPTTPGFVGNQHISHQLSEIGVMLLMFGVGLHFSLDDFLRVKNIAIPGAIAQIVVATLLGWGLASCLHWSVIHGLVFGLALSVASTVVLLRALEDKRLLETQRGQIAIGWLVVEDLMMVIALVLLPVVAELMTKSTVTTNSTNTTSISHLLLLTFVKIAGFIIIMLSVGSKVIPWILEKIAAGGSRELFTLAVLAIAVGIAFGSAKLFGVSFALGAFFAGMLLNRSELSHRAAHDSLPLRDAFAVLFFVSVGMVVNPEILLRHPWEVMATFLVITLGKSIAAFFIVHAFGYPKSTALTIAVSLAQIGEFSFILTGLGVKLGILSETGHELILIGALLSIIINPFLFSLLDYSLTAWLKNDNSQTSNTALSPHPDLRDHAIVIGFGQVGSVLCQLLHEHQITVAVIDSHRQAVQCAQNAGLFAVCGSATSDQILQEANSKQAKIAVLAIPQPVEAGEVLSKLRRLNPSLTLLARAHTDGQAKHFLNHGADGTVLAERELAYSLAEMVFATLPKKGNSLADDSPIPSTGNLIDQRPPLN